MTSDTLEAPHTLRSVQQTLGLSRRVVVGLVDAGVVTPQRGAHNEYRFTFQDVVLLKTAHRLQSARIPLPRMLRSLQRLRRALPGALPLTGLRIRAVGSQIAVSEAGGTREVESGQLVLDFEVLPARDTLAVFDEGDARAAATSSAASARAAPPSSTAGSRIADASAAASGPSAATSAAASTRIADASAAASGPSAATSAAASTRIAATSAAASTPSAAPSSASSIPSAETSSAPGRPFALTSSTQSARPAGIASAAGGRRAAMQPPASADELFARGEVLEAEARAAAEDAYRAALVVDDRHADAYLNLGAMLCESDRAEEATRLYDVAVARCPDEPLLHFNRAIALEDAGRIAAALASYRRCLVLAPDMADAHFNAARLYERSGDTQSALRHFSSYRRLQRT